MRFSRFFVLIGTLWLALAPATAPAQNFPKFTGLVVDAANVLPPETEAALKVKLEALQKDTHRQLVVATIPDLQGYPIDDYGYQLGRAWGVGLKDVNNGAILLIAPNEPTGHRGPDIEVGYGLEPVLTDAMAFTIIDKQMMPLLKAGNIPGAMTAGTDAIIAQLRASPDEAKARTDAAAAEFDKSHRTRRAASGGGGFPFSLIFWGIIFLFVILPMLGIGFGRRKRRGPWDRRYRGDDSGALPIILWSIANEIGREASRHSGGTSWGSGGGGGSDWGGGGSDGSWGGGGFTGGGGGSFGGGGASGSW